MPKIRIIKAPPGSAPDNIRSQWVGVEIPLAPPGSGTGGQWSGNQNAGGYVVTGKDAVAALEAAGRLNAAQYWSRPVPPSQLRFAADCCEFID